MGVSSLEDQEGQQKETRKKGQIMVRGVQVYGEKERGIYGDGWRGRDAQLHILLQDNDLRLT